MPEPRDSSEDATVLFCPFCEEGFEGRVECPEHELALVPMDDLPKGESAPLDRVRSFADPRLGRGPVQWGAVLVLIGFVAPLARSRGLTASGLEIAVDGAINLWLAPGAALAVLWIAWQRRTRVSMRAARVAVIGLAAGGGLPLIYTTRRIGLMAAAANAHVEWRWGVWLMVAGLLVWAIGAARFGGRPLAAPRQHPSGRG
jgi:hypothetical protein